MPTSRDLLLQRLRERPGLLRVGTLPARDAFRAVKQALPRVQDAMRLVELVEERLGDRAERDAWRTPNETCILLRDPAHPGWYLPRRFLYLALDIPPEPEPTFDESVPKEWQEQFLRARQGPEGVLPLPGARTGRLKLEEGEAYVDIRWNTRGLFEQWTATRGDTFFSNDDEPFVVDPHFRQPRPPPVSLFTHPSLRPTGLPLDELADLVVAMKPEEADKGRVLCPVVQPGTVTGSWLRGLWNLRRAAWEGRVPDEGGWVVIDAWNGTALATGPTFDEAVAAWRAHVRAVQPLPPVERPYEGPPPDLDGPEVESETTKEGDRTTIRTEMRIVIHPPLHLPWPEARPENVPAVAIPIDPAPPVPEPLARVGFARVVRLFGEAGENAFAFVRDITDGFVLVGDEAVPAIDPATLDADLDRIDAETRASWADFPGFADRVEKPDYPVQHATYAAWDESGRVPELRGTCTGWSAELGVNGWDHWLRHGLMRVRFLQLVRS